MGRRNKILRNKFQELPPKAFTNVVPPTLPPIPETTQMQTVQNGFAEAVGFGQTQGGAFPGGFSYQQVEDTTTLFENLRWYMVSNFRQLLSQLFVEIGLVQTITCVPVDDGLRGGVLFKSKQLDEDQIKQLNIKMDRENDLEIAGWGAKWNRLFGGAGILILVADQDPEEPLQIAAIGSDTEVNFRAVDMWELFWDKQNDEGYDPAIQEENFDTYNYYAETVHKSRVMRLKGIEAPSFIRPRLRGWGVSEVEALVRSMNQYLKATDLGFEVLDEFKLDVYKIKNLVNTLMSPQGTSKIKERVMLANWQKNYQNALVMDSEDDFDHKQLSFAGLAEAMAGIRMQVAADMRMPITKLFGTSVAAGFSTDQNDMENYNSMIESQVRNKLKYHILQMAQIRCQQLFGMIPDDLELEFKPLRELSAMDQETVKTQKLTRIATAMEKGLISAQTAQDACNKGDLFDVEIDTMDDGVTLDEAQGKDEGKDSQGDEPESSDEPSSYDMDEPGADRADKRTPGIKNENEIYTFSDYERFKRFFNSPSFDKASYEADGGDGWIHPGRKEIFSNPMNVDESLWSKAKAASQSALGEERWQFVVWFYKKQGGKF